MNEQFRQPFFPPAPLTIEETGLDRSYLVELMLKIIYRRGVDSVSNAAEVSRLAGGLVSDIFERMRDEKLIHTLGQLGGDMRAEMRYELTDKGKSWALDAVARCDYAGPAPVTLTQYTETVRAQAVRNRRIGRDRLVHSFGDLVVPPDLVDRLGPAVNSGRSVLMYGPPGTGKSSIAHALAKAIEDPIYVPHCVLVEGELILFFDPTIHKALKEEAEIDVASIYTGTDIADQRYVRCNRPTVITGAELTVEMLDLVYNPVSKTYQAPVQMKASNGVFIIDDLGRQKQTPQQIMNRCVVPMEEGVDYLGLQSGLTFQCPFDQLMIFSTNFKPTDLVDGAGLRRIYFKILIDRPTQQDFITIFVRVCKRMGIAPKEEVITHLLNEIYPRTRVKYAGYQAPYLINQTIARCDFLGIPRELSVEGLEAAWKNLYVDESV